ncbi:hypothetical protein DPQ33_10040 [Oceanidesulfovibrio indonesiensis]|uniref:Uncharacterized protein n=1 Tax=Oceanidesulfovibrio indonesiensis TaxID=54767 RepID=A0A7M3ME84_9BACT|nr:hypothetical protein DPQ33_10040 [Oceanidesulfovibrio indonesiensis]
MNLIRAGLRDKVSRMCAQLQECAQDGFQRALITAPAKGIQIRCGRAMHTFILSTARNPPRRQHD